MARPAVTYFLMCYEQAEFVQEAVASAFTQDWAEASDRELQAAKSALLRHCRNL